MIVQRRPSLIRRFLGRAAFAGGILAWASLLIGLYIGGQSPTPADIQSLKTATDIALLFAVVTFPLGAVAVIIGPYRLAALVGVVFAGLFFLYFASMLAVFSTAAFSSG